MESSPARPTINPEKITALLPVDREPFLTESVREKIQSLGLREKETLHLTLVGYDTGERLAALAPDAAATLAEIAGGREWRVTPLPKFLYIEKDEELDGQPYRRQSLIQECEVPELEAFYTDLATRFGETFPTPYPHVTLGSNSNVPGRELRGIGIYSREDLEKMDVRREVSFR